MAQSRERRNQRRKQQVRARPPSVAAGPAAPRRRNLRRVVIAFLVLVGLAGVLAVSATSDDPNGAAVPVFAPR